MIGSLGVGLPVSRSATTLGSAAGQGYATVMAALPRRASLAAMGGHFGGRARACSGPRREAEGGGEFRGLLEAAPDAIVIVDRYGSITLVNAQTEKVFGYPRQELLGAGAPVEKLVPARPRPGAPRRLLRGAQGPVDGVGARALRPPEASSGTGSSTMGRSSRSRSPQRCSSGRSGRSSTGAHREASSRRSPSENKVPGRNYAGRRSGPLRFGSSTVAFHDSRRVGSRDDTHFGACPHGLRASCLRFAGALAGRPRKTRSRRRSTPYRGGTFTRGSLRKVSIRYDILLSQALPLTIGQPLRPFVLVSPTQR